MKIWKAELVLMCKENNEYKVDFYFELQKEDYKVNEKFDEWIYSEGWICNRLPIKMIVESTYSTRVIQGFDRELSEEELKGLKEDMKVLMQKQLDCEKEIFLQRYDDKIKALTDERHNKKSMQML